MAENENKNESALVVAVRESGLEKTEAQQILENFTALFDQAKKWEIEAKSIVVTDASQVAEMAKAREVRISLKKVRTEAENTRKRLKEDIVRKGKAIDGIANVIKALIEPLEEMLDQQEKFVELKEKREKQERLDARVARIAPLVDDISLYNIADMSDEVFEKLYDMLKITYDNKMLEEKHAEERRLEQEKKEQIFKERELALAPYKFFFGSTDKKLTIDTTEADFKALLDYFVKFKADYDKEQEEIAKQNEKQQKTIQRVMALSKYRSEVADTQVMDLSDEEFEKLLSDSKKEFDRKEVERIEKETKEKVEKEQLARKLAEKERIEKERLEREAKEKAEREEKERKAREEAERLEREKKMAPEREKLFDFAESIRTIKSPEGLSKAGLEVVKSAEAKLLAVSQEIKLAIKNL